MLVRGRHVIHRSRRRGPPGVLDDAAVLVSASHIAALGGWTALRWRLIVVEGEASQFPESFYAVSV